MGKESDCQSKRGREFCRIHGQGKTVFEKRALNHYKDMKVKLEKSTPFSRNYDEIVENFDYAQQNYFATEMGEKEALMMIATLPPLEADTVRHRLETALERRQEFERESEDAYTYVFAKSKQDDAEAKLEKANRKLARAGIEGRLSFNYEEFMEVDPKTGLSYAMVRAKLNQPPLSVQGWDFVASVNSMGEGMVTRTVPGQELNGYRPDALLCEHCGRKRHRKGTYLLKNAEGEIKQVGGNCLEAFLGVKPHGIWALEYDLEEKEPITRERYSYADAVVPLEDVVATALAASDGGKHFMSNKYAQEAETDSTSTITKNYLFSVKNDDKVYDLEAYREQAKQIIAETKFEDGNDYGENMKFILSQSHVDYRTIGYAVSVIGAHKRQTEDKVAKAAKVNSVGFYGDVGEKVGGMKMKVDFILHGESNYGYHSKPNSMIILRGEDGKVVKWNSSNSLDYEAGDEVFLKTGIVKAQARYNDDDQTVMKNVKLEKIETKVEAAEKE